MGGCRRINLKKIWFLTLGASGKRKMGKWKLKYSINVTNKITDECTVEQKGSSNKFWMYNNFRDNCHNSWAEMWRPLSTLFYMTVWLAFMQLVTSSIGLSCEPAWTLANWTLKCLGAKFECLRRSVLSIIPDSEDTSIYKILGFYSSFHLVSHKGGVYSISSLHVQAR